jgi:DNA-binding winged helix-turn-helix (wHTH) protein
MHPSNCRGTVRFSEFELDCDALELRRGRVPVPIRPKPLRLLIYLVTHRDRVVSKRELLDQVWRGVRVSDDALTSALRDLRRALGEGEGLHRMVVTVRARGYRFAASTGEELPAAPLAPFLLFLDNLHLADNPSLLLLEFLSRISAARRWARPTGSMDLMQGNESTGSHE